MIHTIYFSPSGTTKETVDAFAKELGGEVASHDVTVRPQDLEIEATDDVVVFAAPVYAGRVPALAAERFASVRGNGQKAVAMVVYGNRDYDDALLELNDIASQQGFEVIAAGAFIAEHCIFPKVATGRPDASDKLKIGIFAHEIKEMLITGHMNDTEKIKGHRPYKKPAGVPLHPKADKNRCNSCAKCAAECPTGAISTDNPLLTDNKLCITCCRCIKVCPQDARKLGGLLYKVAGWKFVKDNSRRLEPEWFV